MKKTTPILVLSITLLAGMSVFARKPKVEFPIDTKNRIVSYYGIKNKELTYGAGLCKDCDVKIFNTLVSEEFTKINNLLIAEIRKCEKIGFYSTVEQTRPHEISITVSLDTIAIVNDTLGAKITVTIAEVDGREKRVYPYPIKFATPPFDPISEAAILYRAGRILRDLRTQIPYETMMIPLCEN